MIWRRLQMGIEVPSVIFVEQFLAGVDPAPMPTLEWDEAKGEVTLV